MAGTAKIHRFIAAAGCAAALVWSGGAAAVEVEVVATGLDNPRGIARGADGAVYVAEAGRGGSGPCIESSEGATVCYGPTGAVTRLWRGHQERVLEGLPSLAVEDGSGATGPHDLSFLGRGAPLVVVGLGAPPAARSALGAVAGELGITLRSPGPRLIQTLADLAAYEEAANPDGDHLDANPYSVLAVPGGHYVADAAANALLFVHASGRVETVAVFPEQEVPAPEFLGLPPGALIPSEAVPTSIALGPDGALYVGQLTGFPFAPGAANVYRLVPGAAPEVWADGFTTIAAVDFDADGALYVLELTRHGLLSGDPTGALIRVDPDGTRTELLSEGLITPTGMAVLPDGIYVANRGTSAGAGEVLRIRP